MAPGLSAAPVRPADRVDAIDIVRGIALYGVMAVNLVTEFRVSIFQQFLPPTDSVGANRFADAFVNYGLEMKAFSLFSLLFGVGLAIQYERLSRSGTPLRWLLRRLAILLVFGLIHLYFIWNGDILTEYAIAGFVVIPFLIAPRWVVGVASAIFLLFYAVMPLLHLPIPWPGADWFRQHVADANTVYSHGNFAAVLQFSIHEVTNIAPLHMFVFPRTIGLFLLGLFTWRLGVLQRPQDHKLAIVATALIALTAGTLLTVTDAMNLITPESVLAPLGWPVSQLAAATLALGYGASIVWLVEFTSARRLLSAFGPLGRMAFTNYIAQSVVFGFIFFGYGLGLFGRLESAPTLLLGTGFYALQMVVSAWWLKRYRFGPLEWLWRTLMYGKRQPMVIARENHEVSASNG